MKQPKFIIGDKVKAIYMGKEENSTIEAVMITASKNEFIYLLEGLSGWIKERLIEPITPTVS